jgi:putative component of membrane protein insertase Oxa1/YidC/SpoIIIJ protein YidD
MTCRRMMTCHGYGVGGVPPLPHHQHVGWERDGRIMTCRRMRTCHGYGVGGVPPLPRHQHVGWERGGRIMTCRRMQTCHGYGVGGVPPLPHHQHVGWERDGRIMTRSWYGRGRGITALRRYMRPHRHRTVAGVRSVHRTAEPKVRLDGMDRVAEKDRRRALMQHRPNVPKGGKVGCGLGGDGGDGPIGDEWRELRQRLVEQRTQPRRVAAGPCELVVRLEQQHRAVLALTIRPAQSMRAPGPGAAPSGEAVRDRAQSARAFSRARLHSPTAAGWAQYRQRGLAAGAPAEPSQGRALESGARHGKCQCYVM